MGRIKKCAESIRELLFEKFRQRAAELGLPEFTKQDTLYLSTEEMTIIYIKDEMDAVITGIIERRGSVLPYRLVEEVDRASARWTEAPDLH